MNLLTGNTVKKLIMSAGGVFLLMFLPVHLYINLLLITHESHEPFNVAAHFMSSFTPIKVVEIVLFGALFIHALYGIIVNIQNLMARPVGYKVANKSDASFASRYMLHTAIVIGIFISIHLADFFVKAKFIQGAVPEVTYDGGLTFIKDMGTLVIAKFKIAGYSIFYICALLLMGFHLFHGINSAVKTMGIAHAGLLTATQVIAFLYSVIITLGFICIPVFVYYFK